MYQPWLCHRDGWAAERRGEGEREGGEAVADIGASGEHLREHRFPAQRMHLQVQ
ncbi:hypothetical protein Sgleb_06090 [Streptomyces glebosus]|uniref:Uncharacterized protein n=1 Tax=Streptomyces glebosus TaxID=249580 RepID=A0A640SP41_9ACTN|nr:hypothetical protein Sgleb_06090 [Streptomyces glebosus]GHG71304.1 hypothetical protein GCM10010513_43300 [Streptomyces glebosus]